MSAIKQIRVFGPIGEFGEAEEYQLGQILDDDWGAITSICERCTSSEPYCETWYVQVWCGMRLYAEFPKHNLAAIYYPGEQS